MRAVGVVTVTTCFLVRAEVTNPVSFTSWFVNIHEEQREGRDKLHGVEVEQEAHRMLR